MEKEELLGELNKVLMFERGHKGIYEKEKNVVEDGEIAVVLNRFEMMEDEHIGRVAGAIKSLGGEPAKTANAAEFLGNMFATGVNLSGTMNLLKASLFIEEQAYKGYKKLLGRLNDEEMIKSLKNNMIDAGLMYLWLKDRIDRLDNPLQ